MQMSRLIIVITTPALPWGIHCLLHAGIFLWSHVRLKESWLQGCPEEREATFLNRDFLIGLQLQTPGCGKTKSVQK